MAKVKNQQRRKKKIVKISKRTQELKNKTNIQININSKNKKSKQRDKKQNQVHQQTPIIITNQLPPPPPINNIPSNIPFQSYYPEYVIEKKPMRDLDNMYSNEVVQKVLNDLETSEKPQKMDYVKPTLEKVKPTLEKVNDSKSEPIEPTIDQIYSIEPTIDQIYSDGLNDYFSYPNEYDLLYQINKLNPFVENIHKKKRKENEGEYEQSKKRKENEGEHETPNFNVGTSYTERPKRGRPKKYFTEEERKEAIREQRRRSSLRRKPIKIDPKDVFPTNENIFL